MMHSAGVSLINSERQRQQFQCGWSKSHDKEFHADGELARQALALLMHHCNHMPETDIDRYDEFGLSGKEKLRHRDNRIRRMTIIGALVAAEIDRVFDEDCPE